MSAETFAALEDAIAAHLNDEAEDARLLTNWYLVTASDNGDAEVTCYQHVSPDQPIHVSMGLVHLAQRRLIACYEDDD